jgi:hypothetical protein
MLDSLCRESSRCPFAPSSAERAFARTICISVDGRQIAGERATRRAIGAMWEGSLVGGGPFAHPGRGSGRATGRG